MYRILMVLFLALGLGLSAHAKERNLLTCKLEGQNLKGHLAEGYSAMFDVNGEKAIAGEYVLVEEFDDRVSLAPTRLKIRLYRYIKRDGEIERRQLPGGQLYRVGYSRLGEVTTFSYTTFGSSGTHPHFHISTNGRNSVITYSQSGGSQRGYANQVQCEEHELLEQDAPSVDWDNISDSDLLNMIAEMRYRRAVRVPSETLPQKNYKKLVKSLVQQINQHDFKHPNQVAVVKVEWVSEEKCGELVPAPGYYNSAQAVIDYQQETIGYVLPQLKCTGKLKYSRLRWDPNTGKPRAPVVREIQPSIANVIADWEMNLLNSNTGENAYYISNY